MYTLKHASHNQIKGFGAQKPFREKRGEKDNLIFTAETSSKMFLSVWFETSFFFFFAET